MADLMANDPVDIFLGYPNVLDLIFLGLSWWEFDRLRLVSKRWRNFIEGSLFARPSVKRMFESRDYSGVWADEKRKASVKCKEFGKLGKNII